jgi:branched-subunit amino acid transport protein
LIPETVADISLSNERLPAAVIAVLVSLITKNALATIGSGMAALWILQYFLP